MIKFRALFFLLLTLTGCETLRVKHKTPETRFDSGSYVVDYGGCLRKVAMEPVQVGDNLFKDEKGNLFFLAYNRSDESGKLVTSVFIQRFPNACADYIDTDTVVDFSSYDLRNYIDIASFISVGNGMYKDKYRYYEHVMMADGGHFSMREACAYTPAGKGFFKGSDGLLYIQTRGLINPPEEYGPVFYKEVPEIDIPTFEPLCTQGWYARDKNRVYMDHTMTDGRHIYVLEQADAATFTCIWYRWGKDKNHVYENGIILEGMNPRTMTIIDATTEGSFSLVKDEDQVFFGHKEIKDADAASFQCTRTDTSVIFSDKNWIYEETYFLNQDAQYRKKR